MDNRITARVFRAPDFKNTELAVRVFSSPEGFWDWLWGFGLSATLNFEQPDSIPDICLHTRDGLHIYTIKVEEQE